MAASYIFVSTWLVMGLAMVGMLALLSYFMPLVTLLPAGIFSCLSIEKAYKGLISLIKGMRNR